MFVHNTHAKDMFRPVHTLDEWRVSTLCFHLPTCVQFGWAVTDLLGQEAARLGRKALLVTGRTAMRETGVLERVCRLLSAAGVEWAVFDEVVPDPSWDMVNKAVCRARQLDIDLVVGLGGGSVLDVGKLVACLAPGSRSVEIFDQALSCATKGIPYIALPTTAGSGSEVTCYAVLEEPERAAKRGLRGAGLFPDVALVDPALTVYMPRELTLHTGLDALAHAIEAYTSRRANLVSDFFCETVIRLIGKNLPAAVRDGSASVPRQNMMLASLLAGMALTNSGVGVAHSLSHALGPKANLPHGRACILLLPCAMAYNVGGQYEGRERVIDKYVRVGSLLGLDLNGLGSLAATQVTIGFIRDFVAQLGIEGGLRRYGITEDDLGLVAANSSQGSLSTNPRPCSTQDLIDLLRTALNS